MHLNNPSIYFNTHVHHPSRRLTDLFGVQQTCQRHIHCTQSLTLCVFATVKGHAACHSHWRKPLVKGLEG